MEEMIQTEEQEVKVYWTEKLAVVQRYSHMGYALAGGFLGMLIAMSLWALVTVLSQYQVGYMAIGVGLLVAWFVRIMGRGVGIRFALLGAFFALLACLLGNLWSVLIMTGIENSISFRNILIMLNWEIIRESFTSTFSPIDLLFYGFAVYEGFHFSCVPVEKIYAEIKAKEKQGMPITYPWRFPLSLLSMLGIVIGCYLLVTYHDVVVFWYESGKIEAEGRVKNGELDGTWSFWTEDGRLDHTGQYKEGLSDGLWIWFNTQGKIGRTGQYIRGLEEGVWKTYHENGRLGDSLTYEKGRKQGKYVVWNDSGQIVLSGTYEKDIETGLWTEYYDSGQVKSEGEIREGDKTGLWKNYFEDGTLKVEAEYPDEDTEKILNAWDMDRKPMVVNGEGWYVERDKEGNICVEGRVEHGTRTGIWKAYYSSGQLHKTGKYRDGQFFLETVFDNQGKCVLEKGEGKYISYYEDGTLQHECGVSRGIFQGESKMYYPSGALYLINTYKDGLCDGWQTVYYDSGVKMLEGKMSSGKQDSVWCWYHVGGTLSSKANFRDGKKEGKQEFFDEYGTLIKVERWEAGELKEVL